MPHIDINDNVIKEKICDSIEFKENTIQGIFNNFRKEKQGSYFINSEKLRRVNLEYIECLKNGEYSQYYCILKDVFSLSMDENRNKMVKAFNEIVDVYDNVFDDLLNTMTQVKEKSENHKCRLENNLDFYIDVDKRIERFNENWETVRSAGASAF